MPLATFSLFTLAGSGLWNGALIGLGYLLGAQYRLIEEYSRFLNYAVYGRGRGRGPARGPADQTGQGRPGRYEALRPYPLAVVRGRLCRYHRTGKHT
jgi:hypothetical protein